MKWYLTDKIQSLELPFKLDLKNESQLGEVQMKQPKARKELHINCILRKDKKANLQKIKAFSDQMISIGHFGPEKHFLSDLNLHNLA